MLLGLGRSILGFACDGLEGRQQSFLEFVQRCQWVYAEDTAAHPYVYDTRSDAEKACKAAGYHGLCRKGQAGGRTQF